MMISWDETELLMVTVCHEMFPDGTKWGYKQDTVLPNVQYKVFELYFIISVYDIAW